MTSIDPSESPTARTLFAQNSGISDAQVLPLAKNLGLREIPPQCPTPALVESWLKRYGPLWTNGKTHIVVVAGVDSSSQLLVYDPSPINTGHIGWRTFWWYVGGAVDSRDPSATGAVFLYFPLQNA